MQVLAPYDSEDARGLLKAAIRDPDPVVFLENEILYGEPFPVDEAVLDKDFVVPIGKAKVGGYPPLGRGPGAGEEGGSQRKRAWCHVMKRGRRADANLLS